MRRRRASTARRRRDPHGRSRARTATAFGVLARGISSVRSFALATLLLFVIEQRQTHGFHDHKLQAQEDEHPR